jgi:signal transduction histidine kinase
MDLGPGFADGEESRIFEKFYRDKAQGVRGAIMRLRIPIGGTPPAAQPVAESEAE